MDSMDSEKKQLAAMEMETGGEVLPVGPRPGMAICIASGEKKQLAAMEMETGGEVLPVGPQPGMAICCFGQGRVEIALRVMVIMVR